jgi:hypothetical protein
MYDLLLIIIIKCLKIKLKIHNFMFFIYYFIILKYAKFNLNRKKFSIFHLLLIQF